MDQTEYMVTRSHRVGNYAYCQEIVYLFEGFIPCLHFAIDAVKVLGTAGEFGFDFVFSQSFLYRRLEFLNIGFALPAFHRYFVAQFLVDSRLEKLEAAILQLPTNSSQPKAVSQWGIDFKGFAGGPFLGSWI